MHWLVAKFLAERRSNRNLAFLARTSVGDMLAYKLAKISRGFIIDSMTFKYRRKITITEQSGSDLTDYQVLIELNSSNFNFERAQTNGEDIRFTDADGNLLPYWIEEWDSVNKSAKVWVKVPSIPANSSVEIFMYYGNENIPSASDSDAAMLFYDDFSEATKQLSMNCFVTNANHAPLYDMQVPQAIYFNGRTYIVFQGSDLDPYVIYYDHASKSWSQAVKAGDNPLTNDGHGCPCLTIDNEGYLHVFYGCHGGDLRYSKSSNPEDITSWTAMSSPAGACTYPEAWLLNDGSIFLFYRAGGHESDWVYRISTDGGNSWSSETAILDSTSDDGYYVRTWKDSAGKIHFALVRFTPGTIFDRTNVYYFYRDVDGTFKNAAGDTLSLPMDITYLNTNCLVYDSGSEWTNAPFVQVDENGIPYILFITGSGTLHYWKVAKWNGAGWDIVDVGATTDHLFDCGCIEVVSSSEIYAYVISGGSKGVYGDPSDPTVDEMRDRGGDLQLYKSTDGGITWSKVRDIITFRETGELFNNPQPVVNGRNELRVVFCTWEQRKFDNSYAVYAWGDNGFLGNTCEVVWRERNTGSGVTWSRNIGYLSASFSTNGVRDVFYPVYGSNTDEMICVETEAEMDAELVMGVAVNLHPCDNQAYDGHIADSYDKLEIGRTDFDADYNSAWLEELSSAAFSPSLNTKYIISLKRFGSTLKLEVNGNVISATNAAYAHGHFGLIAAAGYANASSGTIKFYYIKARKYTEPEPSVSIGAEETA